MPKRGEPQKLTTAAQRQAMLRGINDPAAVYLFDHSMSELEERGEANFAAALQLRAAAQWTAAIDDMQDAIRRAAISGEKDGERRLAALIKNKREAEAALYAILNGLLLTPQKKRGRPPGEKPEAESAETDEDAAWNAFDSEDVDSA